MHKYAFFDIDNTIFDGYCTSDFYFFLAKRGFVKNTDFVYRRDKEIGKDYHSGKIDYAEASRQVVQLIADILKGFSKKKVKIWKEEFIKDHNKLFDWVKPLFDFLESDDFFIYLISAAASPPVEAISDFLKTDKFYASNLMTKDDIYTGKIDFMLNYEEKTKLIHRITSHLEHSFKIGFGDSLGDVDMLKHMNKAFLYQPIKKELITLAKEEEMYIVDKNNILATVKRNLKFNR
ncbi:hypothetical protein A2774_05220 [Candidatus Roizmanbacteria bacterium RIFCSPHIGHO2_01_FULL_39_12c]|uniref:Phosphoserine phosphatase n=1 Tax=Candidatus Roizmanbacteria bacterium RIFCSPHIGHO2_01_FULL_39_12c TaxID=1802031 RepID=A0A1F7GBT5_9BACT|nr:MAG: hypothetical protein A2774_05220 [Candidatus Roizmanbacteria bacterium RIFCSPHIGHO2_01_FULL_39_12c]